MSYFFIKTNYQLILNRPISSNLLIYIPQLSSLLSIWHRFSGLFIFFSLFLTIYHINLIQNLYLMNNVSFICWCFNFSSYFYFFLQFIIFYHFFNGFRFIFNTFGFLNSFILIYLFLIIYLLILIIFILNTL